MRKSYQFVVVAVRTNPEPRHTVLLTDPEHPIAYSNPGRPSVVFALYFLEAQAGVEGVLREQPEGLTSLTTHGGGETVEQPPKPIGR